MNRQRPLLYAVLAAAAGVALVLLVAVLTNTYGLVAEIREQQKVGRGITRTIESCTKPTGKCFKRAQRDRAAFGASINKVTVYAATCASKRPGQSATEIQRCVVRLLAEDRETRKQHNR